MTVGSCLFPHCPPPTAHCPLPMKWPPFFILAYIVLGMQIGLSGIVNVHGAKPDFVLMAAIFIALNTSRDSALLGCFILGLLRDLLAGGAPLGLMAFVYGLVGMFAISTQEIVHRDHALTHFSLGLCGGIISGAVVFVHGWIYPWLHPASSLPRPWPVSLITSAIYTALLTPILLLVLRRMKKFFNFRSARAAHGPRR